MALIKKQIFRPSKDENLQQFLAKDGADKARWPALTSRSMLETYRQDALDDSRRSVEQGQAEANKKAKAKKAVKSEPKSPWDDESDALAQKAFEVDPEGGAKQYDKKERDAKRQRLFERSVKYLKDNYPDQGSDNSNSADDTTGKQIKLAVQDAWFGKGSRDDLFPPGTPSSWAQMDAALASKKESAKRPPGKGQKAKWVAEDYDADEDGPHKVEGHWSAKEFIIEGVQKAWLEKRGPVDRLTGGRVKFENKPEKQYAPESVDWTGRELQVTGKNSKLMRGAARALGAKKTVSPSMESTQTKRATKAAGLDYAAKSVGGAVWDAWFEKARTKEQQSAGLKRQTPRMDKPGTPLVGSPNPQGDPWEIRDRRKELDDSIETSRQKPKEEASNSPPSMAAGGGGGNNPPKPPKRPPRKQFRPESDNPSDKYPKPDYSKYVE